MRNEEFKFWKHGNSFFTFTVRMCAEYQRAEQKFPEGKRLFGALSEEVGEVARALLKIEESGESPQNVYDELIQVAATAYRLATIGDPSYGYEGTKCHHQGCSQNTARPPCALCYE